MPKTKIAQKYSAPPPIDEGWGAVLVRKEQMGISLKDLAEKSGVSYDTLRHIWGTPPITWNARTRDAILKSLGLEAKLVINERNK